MIHISCHIDRIYKRYIADFLKIAIIFSFAPIPLSALASNTSVTEIEEEYIKPDSAINILHEPRELPDSDHKIWMLDSTSTMKLPSEETWWKRFNDNTLDRLIALAEKNNYNLKIAMRRLDLSRNAIAQAKAGYFPNIGVSGGWQIGQSSGATIKQPVSPQTNSYFSLGASASWEIDVFGRVAANIKAQKAGLNVSRADYTGTLVSLCGDVARQYINLLLYRNQLAIALTHIKSQQRIVNITQARQESGLASMLDVAQANTVLYSTQATIPSLEALIENTFNSLAVLTGVSMEDIHAMIQNNYSLPDSRQLIPEAIPANLVRRRPDVIAAEYDIEQQAALIGIATKDYLPSLSISGSIGTSARNISNLFSSKSFSYMVSPQISWTVFDGKLRNLRVAEQKLQLESAIDSYNLTLLTATEEVNNALANYYALEQEALLREKVVGESERSLTLALDRYKQGLADFSNVVTAQQSVLANQNSLVSSKAKAIQSLIDLYIAIGGGWDKLPE